MDSLDVNTLGAILEALETLGIDPDLISRFNKLFVIRPGDYCVIHTSRGEGMLRVGDIVKCISPPRHAHSDDGRFIIVRSCFPNKFVGQEVQLRTHIMIRLNPTEKEKEFLERSELAITVGSRWLNKTTNIVMTITYVTVDGNMIVLEGSGSAPITVKASKLIENWIKQ